MKKSLILTFVCGVVLTLYVIPKTFAQQSDFLFEQQYPFEWSYAGSHSLEIHNEKGGTECYLVAVCNIDAIGYTIGSKGFPARDPYQPAKVLKLSPEGELLGEMTMHEEGRASSIIELYCDPHNPKYCLAIGTIQDSTLNHNKPYLAKFDQNLNLSWLKEIQLPETYQYLFGGRSLMDSNGDIVFCSWPLNSEYSDWSNLLYIRISSEGELLAMGESPYTSWMFYSSQGGMFEYYDGSFDYGQTFVGRPEGYNNPPVFLVRMNRDFTEFSAKELVENIRVSETDGVFIGDYYAEAFTTSLPDGSKYMTSRGSRYDGWNPELWDEVIVSIKMDQNDSIIAVSYTPHDNDSARTLAFNHGMDESSNGDFFLCNGVYEPRAWQYGEIDSLNHFTVTKTDVETNVIWSRSYEDGEHVFQPCSVMATSDGGCLVTGRNWTLDKTEAKLFVLKFFADGSLSVPKMEEFVRPYCFYPNPVKDQLRMQFSPDVQPDKVELYDLQGRLVRTQSKAFESIDMNQLPAGTYTLHVTLEDGKTYADKVVKE